MKRLLLAILLLCAYASATTTVTGTVGTLGGGVVTSGTFVRFWLRGCGGNQPRIGGTALIAPTQGGVFFFDLPVNGSGAVSGTLYSTRDGAGTGNGDIECGGSKTSVWYGMQAFTGGKGGPEVAVHAKNGAVLNISTVTPITSNPAIVAPTGDNTYCRLDAGNGPCGSAGNVNTGTPNTFTAANIFNNAGTFSNTQMNLYVQSLINGCSPLTEFSSIFTPPSKTTEALTGCLVVPSTSTVFQGNAVAGYINNQSGAATPSVAVFGLARVSGQSNGRAWGGNFVGSGAVGFPSASLYGVENDCNAFNIGDVCHGMLINGSFAVQPTTTMGIEVTAPVSAACPTCHWPFGFRFDQGATVAPDTNNAAVYFYPVAAGVNQVSQGVTFLSNDPVSGLNLAFLNQTAGGEVQIKNTAAGKGLLVPNLNAGGVGPTPNNLGFVDGITPLHLTTGQVADASEGYPVNNCTNCLRGRAIYSPPEYFTSAPMPPNFAAELILMAGIVNTTTCTFSNLACHVTDVPIPIRPNTTVRGLVGPVNSNGNMSGGNVFIPGPNYPFAVGIPTLGTITCTGTGGPGGTYDMAVQMVVNLETHGGATPIPGHSAYVKQHVVCGAGTSTMNIPSPTGGQAGSLAVVDYTIGNSANGANGDYFIQRPTTASPNPGVVSCGTVGTIDNNNDCKISGGGATIPLASMQTCTTSACTQPMEADDEEGFPVDTSNMMFPMGANQPVSFLMSFGNMSVACLNGQSNVPFVVFGNVSGQEGSGVGNNGHVVMYGNCGSNLAGISGAFVYAFSQSPNSMWAHMQISGGPISGAIPNYCFILDGRPNDGGASGAARTISDITCAPRGGGTKNRGLLAQGFRVHTGIDHTHWECNSGVDCLYVTNGARVEITNGEAFTTGNAIHLTATAGPSTIKSFGAQGINSSIQDRFLSTAVAVQDDGVGGGSYKGYLTDWSSGTTLTRFLQLNPMTFANLTGQITCAAATEGTESSVTDDNTALAFNATITGGGTNHVHAFCNGTAWVMQ